MQIFISYASEHRDAADRIAVGLQQEGHRVFFDRDDLAPGEGFDQEIRRRLRDADLIVFLVSPRSVATDSYAFTELELARRRWRNPAGRILPVMVEATPIERVPAYLRAVTILEPRGDLTADVLARVEELGRRRTRRIAVRLALALVAAAAATLAAVYWLGGGAPPPAPRTCALQATVEGAGTAAGAGWANLLVDVTGGGSTSSFTLIDGSGPIEVDAGKLPSWSLEIFLSDGTLLGQEELVGCPSERLERALGDSARLVLAPR